MIYLGDARIFKYVKWDREVLGENSCCSRKSVLAGARWISKEEVWRQTERDGLSGRFWWFTTGHCMYTPYSDLIGYDVTKFCSASMGVARIFQRGGHTDSYIGYSPNCQLNIVGCLLTKRLTKGGVTGTPGPPPPWLRPWPASLPVKHCLIESLKTPNVLVRPRPIRYRL